MTSKGSWDDVFGDEIDDDSTLDGSEIENGESDSNSKPVEKSITKSTESDSNSKPKAKKGTKKADHEVDLEQIELNNPELDSNSIPNKKTGVKRTESDSNSKPIEELRILDLDALGAILGAMEGSKGFASIINLVYGINPEKPVNLKKNAHIKVVPGSEKIDFQKSNFYRAPAAEFLVKLYREIKKRGYL